MGARMCTEAEVKRGALLELAQYFHEYVMIDGTATCDDEKLEYATKTPDDSTTSFLVLTREH